MGCRTGCDLAVRFVLAIHCSLLLSYRIVFSLPVNFPSFWIVPALTPAMTPTLTLTLPRVSRRVTPSPGAAAVVSGVAVRGSGVGGGGGTAPGRAACACYHCHWSVR
jgi:hypothetical protein